MDVACNRFIKFDAFREHALEKMDADLVATGGRSARSQRVPVGLSVFSRIHYRP